MGVVWAGFGRCRPGAFRKDDRLHAAGRAAPALVAPRETFGLAAGRATCSILRRRNCHGLSFHLVGASPRKPRRGGCPVTGFPSTYAAGGPRCLVLHRKASLARQPLFQLSTLDD